VSNEILRFDAAINPYGCAPSVVEEMERFARSKAYRFYGEPFAESLRERLGEHLGLSADHVLVYNGAGEALVWQFIAHLLLPQGRLMAPHPSYERFVAVGARCATEVVHVPLSPEFALDVDRMIEVGRQKRISVALLSSPNNPTGNSLLTDATLRQLLDAVPECLWIVDEAYADYPGVTFAPLTAERENLVVLRTFSKAYGLAGLRVGYAVAHPRVAAQMREMQIPWAVDSMALVAAQAALADQAYLREVVSRIRADCGAFGAALDRVEGIDRCHSDANFFLLDLNDASAADVAGRLASESMVVRQREDMPHHIRVTSMLPEENIAVVGAIRRAMAESAG
jgi:histidinol-phosphate aminotransferase